MILTTLAPTSRRRTPRPLLYPLPRPLGAALATLALLAVAASVLVAVVAAPPPRAAEAAAVKQEWVYLGRSVQGRPIFALHRWTPGASKRVLVIGSMHGNETAGHDVTSRLYRWTPPANVSLWIVRTVNPDGVAARRRKNARGVDLNRNFPHNWARIAPPGSANYPGPYAGSEPETRALMAFTKRLQPRMTVIMHQPLYGIDSYAAKRKEIVSDLARYSGFPVKSFACGRVCHGTYTGWHNRNTPGAAVTVEFGWTPTTTQKERMTRAILLTGSRR